MSGKRITPLSFDQAAQVNKVIRATDDSGPSTEEVCGQSMVDFFHY